MTFFPPVAYGMTGIPPWTFSGPRSNPDDRLRDLERQALASGDPVMGFQLYLEKRRAGEEGRLAEREHAGFESGLFESQYGPVWVTATSADHVNVSNTFEIPGHTDAAGNYVPAQRVSHPWIVNRVPVTFHIFHFYRFPDGTWKPYSPTDPSDEWRRRTDKGDMSWLGRADRPHEIRSSISEAVAKKVDPMLRSVVTAWAQSRGATLHQAELGEVSRALQSAENELNKLEEQADEVRARIGQLYLRELATKHAGPRQNPWGRRPRR